MNPSRWASEQAELDPNATAEELVETANLILSRQFVSRKDRAGAVHFTRAAANTGYFSQLFASLGFRFVHSDQWGYVGYVCPNPYRNMRVPKQETIVLLCLRYLYSTSAEKGYFVDGSADVLVDEDEISDLYTSLGARTMKTTEMRAILENFRRRGILRFDTHEPTSNAADITICTPIVEVVDESFITRFNAWAEIAARGRNGARPDADDEPADNDETQAEDEAE